MFEHKKELAPGDLIKAEKRFEWLVGFMIVRYHFIHHMLMMMTKRSQPGFGTFGVRVLSGAKFELVYDPCLFLNLTDAEATYIFYHEIMHIALHHCTTRNFDRHDLGNIAHDLAVNELIPVNPGSCEPPRDKKGKVTGCFVSEYKKQKEYKDIEEKQSCEWYYAYLLKKMKDNGGGGADGKGDGIPGPGSAGKGEEDPQKGRMDSHDGWKEDEIADEKVRAKIKEIEHQNLWGNMGSGEKELIMAAQTRRINWHNLIRRFFGNLAWHTKEATRKRPNRRTGYVHPGNKNIMVDRHLVAVDTSGSIDSGLLTEFLGIINGMTDYMPIDMMQFDAAKTAGPTSFDRRKLQYEFKGRGGTNFDPVFETVNKYGYKSVTICTDGCAAAPSPPKRAQVLWVLPEGCNPPVEWGQRVHIRKAVE